MKKIIFILLASVVLLIFFFPKINPKKENNTPTQETKIKTNKNSSSEKQPFIKCGEEEKNEKCKKNKTTNKDIELLKNNF